MTDDVRDSYDAMAEQYAALDHRIGRVPTDRSWLAAFAQVAAQNKGAVADLGCGTGHVVNHLSELGLNVSGYDISPAQIATAHRSIMLW